ncbi:transcription termination/antitermination protein NusG [Maribacter dokdonensis]|uniref:transcription termination/antitermination protein NusG n=1 Tax=Maribacter dokdonensis TaxID=320912 RepID=UPI001C09F9BF|nr:UpxY family transcription antiterminator [Maribacter dokdonensis]MBU2902966.1 UpxY family transcription antiterminator [Maribacter dokdonensis]
MKTHLPSKWYTIYVRQNFEKKLAKELQNSGFQVFLPLKKEEKVWSDRKKISETPIFPSYLFLNLPDEQTFRRALSIVNIKFFIRFGSEFALLKESEIHQIKILEQSGCIYSIEILEHLFKKGEQLQIEKGPLKGLKCFFDSLKGADYIIVFIESIRQNIKVTLPLEYMKQKLAGV